MKIFNSLSREVEEFVPVHAAKKGPTPVGMYTCGPTVYDFAHIGHGRKYVYDDVLRRVLAFNGYEVTHVQNVTDVGHLSSDSDEGEDKLEKGARKAGKTVWEVADFFTRDFYASMDALNILRPTIVCKATDHIPEQISLVEALLAKGFAYDTPEAIYFDVSKFPRYDGLFGQKLTEKRAGVREEVHTDEHKKNSADFALWFRTVGRFADHAMKWNSPWGEGFPGWHIECSAMAMKYLGESFDFHTGGEDHMPVHHPNEIAQSEAVTGKPFAKYWIHHAFLSVDGQKMSKSLGNTYKVGDVVEKGFSPLALRYLYLTAHYRTPMNFTWSALASAQSAYEKLVGFVTDVKAKGETGSRVELSAEKLKKLEGFRQRFAESINNDMGLPQAVAVLWELIKSNVPDYDKLDQLLEWDTVLGLKLAEGSMAQEAPEEIVAMAQKRDELRKGGRFVEADSVRLAIEKSGWVVLDTKLGSRLKPKG